MADDRGSVLIEVEDPCWSVDPDDMQTPPLRFDGPGEALAAYLHAETIQEAGRGRRRAAFERLGREDPEL